MNSTNLDIINPESCRQWNDLLMEREDYSIFHTTNWARTLHESYGFEPRYFSVIEGCKLTTLIPVMEIRSLLTGCRGVSLPFSDFCEPLLPSGWASDILTTHIASHGRTAGWKSLEFRSDVGQASDTPCYRHYYAHTVSLSCGEERLYKGLRASTRRNIVTATRQGVSVLRGTSMAFVDEFYRMNCLTRKQHGLPPQPYIFFKKLHEHLLSQGMGTIFLARHKSNTIAGAVFLNCGTKVIYKFGASEREHQHLRANNLVMWEAMRAYSCEGYQQFSFGRTEPENEGLRQFKNGWGGNEQTIRYYRYDICKDRYVSAGSDVLTRHAATVAKLPLPLLKIAGKYLYRHVG